MEERTELHIRCVLTWTASSDGEISSETRAQNGAGISKKRKKLIKSKKAQEGDAGVDVGYKDACRCTTIVFRPKQPKEHARYEIASWLYNIARSICSSAFTHI